MSAVVAAMYRVWESEAPIKQSVRVMIGGAGNDTLVFMPMPMPMPSDE